MLETDRARLADIEAQILHLECSLATLRIEKTLVQERLESYQYPVLALPTEIVSEIFIHFLPTYPRVPPLTGILSPASLTQICRQWREIALATPTLWRAVSLSFIDIPFERQIQLIERWFSRSRACPLSIQLIDNADLFSSDNVYSILAAIAAHRSRLQHMKLHLSSSHLHVIQGGMPLLHHLDLQIHQKASDESGIDTDAFRHLPMLRSVVLDDIAAANIEFPWGQLTSLALNRVFLYECFPVLKQTFSLVHCDLRLFGTEVGADDSIITLPCLESLALIDPSDDEVNECLRFFIAPALRSLQTSENFLGSDPIDSLESFISASRCTLQAVCMTGEITVSRDAYREAFPSVPGFSFLPNFHGQYLDPLGDEDSGDGSEPDPSEVSASELSSHV
ncbi:hypothetical protein DFH06DRAFT_1195535 [Mycena polygramma]|nr:hypothetical protein DFH06DRAFT_1195535 [Mycena polygramma]